MFKRKKKKVNQVALLTGMALTAAASAPMTTFANTNEEPIDDFDITKVDSSEMKVITLSNTTKTASDLMFIPVLQQDNNPSSKNTNNQNQPMIPVKATYSKDLPFNGQIDSFLKKDDKVFFFHEEEVEVYNNQTRELLWKAEGIHGKEIIFVNDLMIVSSGLEVSAYNITTGAKKWHEEYEFSAFTPNEKRFFVRSIFSTEEHLYYLASTGNVLNNTSSVYEVDLETGEKELVYELNGIEFSKTKNTNAIKKSNNAFYHNPSFDIIRFAIDGKDNSYVLKPESGYVVDYIPTDEKIYVVTRDYANNEVSNFYVIKAETGQVEKSYKINNPIEQLYLGDGYIHLIGNGIYQLDIN